MNTEQNPRMHYPKFIKEGGEKRPNLHHMFELLQVNTPTTFEDGYRYIHDEYEGNVMGEAIRSICEEYYGPQQSRRDRDEDGDEEPDEDDIV